MSLITNVRDASKPVGKSKRDVDLAVPKEKASGKLLDHHDHLLLRTLPAEDLMREAVHIAVAKEAREVDAPFQVQRNYPQDLKIFYRHETEILLHCLSLEWKMIYLSMPFEHSSLHMAHYDRWSVHTVRTVPS